MDATETLTEQIAAVNASEQRDLGITREAARELMDAITDADLTDDAALSACDLLNTYVSFGRAW